ncbi:hypothetical protein ID866_11055, partial [Astraeus odoratus]
CLKDAKVQAEHTVEDWELVSEASLNPNSDDDKATNDLWKKVKEDCMKERAAERRWKCEEEEQRLQAEAGQKVQEEAEWLVRQEAEQKKEEEEKAQWAGEAKQSAEEAVRAAEAQRRTVEGQCKLSIVIPMGGSSHRSTSGMARGKLTACKPCCKAKVSCSWLKAAGGVTQKQRRMEAKEDDGEDNKEDNEDDSEGDFTVLLALVQEHRDALSALTMTLSTLLKEFRGYHHKQWDLHASQVKGLKALQKEMRKANALKAKELKATTKGKEKASEVMEELSESGDEEEQAKSEGSKDGDGDGDIEMGAGPSASAT